MRLRVLRQLLWRRLGGGNLLAAMAAMFAGLVLVFGAVELSLDFRDLMARERLAAGNYLVLAKRISFDTLQGGRLAFSREELTQLGQQPGILRVGLCTTARFQVNAQLGRLFGLESEMCLEAMPDWFLDCRPPGWDWQPGQSQVPVIFPSSFIDLYNLVFAPGRGLPPLARETVTMIPFELYLAGRGQETTLAARVVAVSDRAPSIAVPPAFLDWANARFGRDPNPGATRVVVEVDDPGSPALGRYLEQAGYQTNRELLRTNRWRQFVRAGSGVTAGLGLGLVGLAFLLLQLHVRLLLSSLRDEVTVLLALGYEAGMIVSRLVLGIAALAVVVAVGAAAALPALLHAAGRGFASVGLELPGGLHPVVVPVAAASVAFMVLGQWLGIRRSLRADR